VNSHIRVSPIEAPPPPGFRSGRAELDDWLAKFALQATRAGSARTYLAFDDADVLVGYLALCAGEVQLAQADERIRRGMPRHSIPAVLLARLAVARDRQEQGVGRELVWHAASLTLRVSRLIAARALVVDALDEPTASFYEHVGFTRLIAGSLRMRLLVKDLEALAGEQQRAR
jgi:predicted N-acetyltransferase YhbS